MAKEVSPDRVAAIARAARVPVAGSGAQRIARTVTTPVNRFASANIALDMEVEPATFVAIQRKDAQS